MQIITRIRTHQGLRMKFKTLFMSDDYEEKHTIILICHSFLISPCNSWVLGIRVLSLFKLVSQSLGLDLPC